MSIENATILSPNKKTERFRICMPLQLTFNWLTKRREKTELPNSTLEITGTGTTAVCQQIIQAQWQT